ncbi:porin family protein [Porphyromonas crevioricanis]|uniref:porin family protein n=1 Tax=Porphyromonas crevioricanis TaxID=393921 RepID=UPI00068D9160|nr:porin family protein [Porphyromonas crevioricanis]
MKKILLSAALVLGSVAAANAQIGFKADANLGFSNIDINDSQISPKMIPGYRVSGAVEIPFAGDVSTGLFYFSPGLTVLSKGAKAEAKSLAPGTKIEATARPHYLQVPLQLGARFRFAENMGVSLQFGPYLSYGFAGKAKAELTNSRGKIEEDINLFEDSFILDGSFKVKAPLERFDYGATIQAALEFSRFYAQVGTDIGFANVASDTNKETLGKENKIKNYDFFVGVGIRF